MKKIFFVALALFMAATLFGQNAKATGLTDSDVVSFCKNFKKIDSDFKKLGLSLQDKEGLYIGVDAEKKAKEVLNKNGISGDNSVDKLRAIAYGYVVERYDEAMAADPETAKMLKSLGQADPMAEVRGMVADSDKKAVSKHLDKLKKVFDD